jgi:5-formyltetrahydrofolate cyclo-ligase
LAEPADPLKSRLRTAMRDRRRALRADTRDAAGRAALAFPAHLIAPPGVAAGYHPVGAELDPLPLMARLAAAGWTLALPVTVDRASPLVFRMLVGALAADVLGVPAPPPTAPEVVPDLVLAPVLAFDRQGRRLGQGGGHYDRTLRELRARRPVVVIGLAYAGQEVARVPCAPHDQRLDAILTETGYIEAGKDN